MQANLIFLEFKTMGRILIAQLMILIASATSVPIIAGGYWLVIGSFRQGPGVRPEVSGITSPSVYAIPMESMEKSSLLHRIH